MTNNELNLKKSEFMEQCGNVESKISCFMNDSTKSGTGKMEQVVDYFLSWTIRCASQELLTRYNNEKLFNYCQKILSVLLFDDPLKIIREYRVISVKTWKQWEHIDLRAEIVLENKSNKIEKYALLIENKVYTRLHSNQLERYREIFENKYKGTEFELRYVYFTCHPNLGEDEMYCIENGFKPYTMDEVYNKAFADENVKYTGNSLFDEFWLCNWG